MAATHSRRRKSESRLESTSFDPTNFISPLVNAGLSVKDNVLIVLKKSGPHTVSEIVRKCQQQGKITTTAYAVRKSLTELYKLGLVVKVNGGYAIYNWMDIGA